MKASDRLMIERACERLVLEASYALDLGDAEAIARCFTETCQFIRPSTYPDSPIVGRGPLIEIVRARSPHYVGRHVMSNIRVSAISTNEARATSFFCNFAAVSDPAVPGPCSIDDALRSLGEYEDHLTLGTCWQIRRRVGRFIFGSKFSP